MCAELTQVSSNEVTSKVKAGDSELVIQRLRYAFEATLGIPFTSGNRIEPLVNGDEIFPAMLEAIEQAEQTIDFLTFVYWTGDIAERFAEAFAQAAERGCEVKVLLDAFGARPMDRTLIDRMTEAGCSISWFRPLRRLKFWKIDHRTHRKVLICDQRVGFTGGVGIAEEWEGDAGRPEDWRDTHFRITGPAVLGLRSGFLGNWVEAGNNLPSIDVPGSEGGEAGDDAEDKAGDDGPGEALVQTVRSTASIKWADAFLLMRLAIRQARSKLKITTAYFVPHEHAVELLCDAAERGVDVEILLPGPHTDERLCRLAGQDRYAPLLEAGGKIYQFQPTMLHAKVLTVDGVLALIGSANFNHRSIQKDDELSLTVLDTDLVEQLDKHFELDRDRSKPIDPQAWQDRGLWQRSKETATRLIRGEL
jgi:cardiolipin synthase